MDVFGQLKAVSYGVKRLSSRRRDLRYANMTLQDAETVLQEIELLRSAALTVMQNVTGVARRHAETAIGWLDVFRQDITLFKEHLALGIPDAKGQQRAKQYETYKARIIMSIDNAVQNAERVPLQRSFWKRARDSIAYASILAGTAFGFSGLPMPRAYAEEPKEVQAKPALTELTTENIEKLMEYDSVESVLKDDKILSSPQIDFVKYDEKTKSTNYEKIIFQQDVKDADKQPVVVYFYSSKKIENKAKPVCLRGAIMFADAARKHENVKFVAYDVDIDPVLAAENYAGLKTKYDLEGIPSLMLYSTYDLSKGETKDKNGGKIKQIDVMQGASADMDGLLKMLKSGVAEWIRTNIDGDKGYCWRLNNSSPWAWTKVQITQ